MDGSYRMGRDAIAKDISAISTGQTNILEAAFQQASRSVELVFALDLDAEVVDAWIRRC